MGDDRGSIRRSEGGRRVLGSEGVDELVELSIEHMVEFVEGELYAVIRDPVLLVVIPFVIKN